MSTPSEAAVTAARQRAVLGVTCLALATVVAAVASLNVAVPSIARDTHATLTQLSWIIDAYSLVFAALLLLGGAIGDRFGRRRALLAGLAVFGAGSAAAMASDSAGTLIAVRGVLGLGAALVMPATLSTITSTFPREQRARAVGTWAGVAGASAILGLLASGLLLEAWSWRSVFGLNIALAVLALVGTLLVIPESADPEAPGLDLVGALITVAGLGVLVYSIIEAPTVGWTDRRTLGALWAGLVILVGFVFWELSRRNPLIDPRLFRHRAFAAGTLSLTLQFFAFFGFIFLVLQYLQLVRGDSPLVAALSLIPMALAMMPSARLLAPRLAGRAGTRRTCVLGLLLIAGGLTVLSRLDGSAPYWLLLCGLLPLGSGMGLAMTPATTTITDALPPAQQGVGSAVNDLARELGGALGIAVLGSVMQSAYRDRLDLSGVPDPVAAQARDSVAVALRLGPEVAERARAAFVDGMSIALLCAAVVALLAAAAVTALLHRARPGGPTAARPAPEGATAEVGAARTRR
ncbi:MFS transporter [Streptomyces sp. MS06]|uniref:MFS transporter n=1 Tax=Streptomyces sp. MS06 TaxID=3385974 RepID=UPI0039A00D6C